MPQLFPLCPLCCFGGFLETTGQTIESVMPELGDHLSVNPKLILAHTKGVTADIHNCNHSYLQFTEQVRQEELKPAYAGRYLWFPLFWAFVLRSPAGKTGRSARQ